MTPHRLHFEPLAPDERRRRWLGSRAYWLCQIGGWGGVFLLLLGPLPFNSAASAAEVAALFLFSVTGVALSHLLRIGIRAGLGREGIGVGLLARLAPWLVGLPVAHVAMQIAWARTVLPHQAMLMTTRPGLDPALLTFVDLLGLSAGLFIVWTGSYIGLRIYRQYQAAKIERLELAAHIQDAAWQALRAQLNPHLLFNSLNCIRALIPRDLTAPREALTHLSELLRSSLSLKQDELIPLKRELETVESFFALERLRFEQRLRVATDIAPAAHDWLVPPFLVQILAENAVNYGVAPYEDGGDIQLHIAVRNDCLVVELRNRGQLGQKPSGKSTGLGLANLRSRLALLFGPAATLTVADDGPAQVLAHAVVPANRATPGARPPGSAL
jgi:two-component system LytT family sensor kinase